MARSDTLFGPFAGRRIRPIAENYYMPLAYLTSDREEEGENPVVTLMDTGSSVILLKLAYAAHLLHMPTQEVLKSKTQLEINGVGNGIAFGWKINLRLRAAQKASQFMDFSDTWIFAIDAPLPYGCLFGQIGGMQGRLFQQRNKADKRVWNLRVLR